MTVKQEWSIKTHSNAAPVNHLQHTIVRTIITKKLQRYQLHFALHMTLEN